MSKGQWLESIVGLTIIVALMVVSKLNTNAQEVYPRIGNTALTEKFKETRLDDVTVGKIKGTLLCSPDKNGNINMIIFLPNDLLTDNEYNTFLYNIGDEVNFVQADGLSFDQAFVENGPRTLTIQFYKKKYRVIMHIINKRGENKIILKFIKHTYFY